MQSLNVDSYRTTVHSLDVDSSWTTVHSLDEKKHSKWDILLEDENSKNYDGAGFSWTTLQVTRYEAALLYVYVTDASRGFNFKDHSAIIVDEALSLNPK